MLIHFVILILVAFGFRAGIKASLFNRLQFKPFNCSVCLAFWGGFLLSGFYCAFNGEYFFAHITPEYETIHVSMIGIAFCVAINAFVDGLIATGAMYIFNRIWPEMPDFTGRTMPSPPPVDIPKEMI